MLAFLSRSDSHKCPTKRHERPRGLADEGSKQPSWTARCQSMLWRGVALSRYHAGRVPSSPAQSTRPPRSVPTSYERVTQWAPCLPTLHAHTAKSMRGLSNRITTQASAGSTHARHRLQHPAPTFVQTLMEHAPHRPSRWISMTRWPRCGRSVASVCEGNMRLDMPRTSVDAWPDCRTPRQTVMAVIHACQ